MELCVQLSWMARCSHRVSPRLWEVFGLHVVSDTWCLPCPPGFFLGVRCIRKDPGWTQNGWVQVHLISHPLCDPGQTT